MSDVVISAEGLGKKYVIGHQSAERERYTALRDVIARQVRGLGRSAMDIIYGRPNIAGDEIEEFWALKDIDFEISRGDVVGVIGRNGAGKSTLLKVLSRITEPSKGRVKIKGRVASLLEVGTGFHPELTGRENIYLNGAILGMTRSEIKRKFDEIVDFAGVEQFLDTPVKRYSSGMYVRLAFSVAAHLEPEILVVDEVLAVGDAEFRKKCLGKMQDVAVQGRTIIFVSHDMGTILSLCPRTILLESGTLVADESTDETVRLYGQRPQSPKKKKAWIRTGTGQARIVSLETFDGNGRQIRSVPMGGRLDVVVTVKFNEIVNNPTYGINVVTDNGILVSDCRSSHYGVKTNSVIGTVTFQVTIDPILLYPRSYLLEPWVTDTTGHMNFDWVKEALFFDVLQNPSLLYDQTVSAAHGIALIKTRWQI